MRKLLVHLKRAWSLIRANLAMRGIVSDCCDIRGYSFDSFEEDTIESMAVAVGTRVEDVLSIFVRYQMAVAVGARVEDVLSIFVRYQMAVAVGTRVEDVLSIFVGYQMAVAVVLNQPDEVLLVLGI
ncbi:hypothetical protein STEG23_006488 [Scotinomys teguina]